MTQLSVGIIGCGNISTTYLKFARLFKALKLVAVADINIEVAQVRAAQYNVRADSVTDLLSAPDVDVIVNLTIPLVHYDVTRQILEAGKHAYSEKPLVLTLDEGMHLRNLASSKNLRVGSAPDTFLGGAHQLARAAIDDGKIGQIIGGTCHVMGRGMEAWHPNPDFFFQPGAGPILDIGPYYVTNLIQLLGPVKSVVSLATTTFQNRTIGNGDRIGETVPVNTPTNIHALLAFANGATVTLGTSWDVWVHQHGHMELYGTDASLFLPDPNFFGGTVEIGRQDGEIVALPEWDHPFGVANDDEGRANYRCAGLADMAMAIVEGRDHRCNIDLALHAIDVLTAILKAGKERQFIDLTTTCQRPASLSPTEASSLLL